MTTIYLYIYEYLVDAWNTGVGLKIFEYRVWPGTCSCKEDWG